MVDYVTESKPAIIDQDIRSSARLAVVGAIVGILVWGVTFLLERFVLRGLFCADTDSQACTNVVTYSGNIAAVIVAVIGVIGLVRMNVYRPLLIALGAAISLWGLAAWVQGVGLIEQIAWTVGLYALFYSLYAWIARIRSVPVVLIVFVMAVVASRLVPSLL